MSKDYSEYLAIQVLNEGQTVSYRSLSRALKVHSNLAKQMLYDFHHKQNTKKSGTLHATYLLAGSQRTHQQSSQTNGAHSQDGADISMRSSPFPSSSAPQPKAEDTETESSYIKLVTLANEEDVEVAKAQFDQLDSIHIYSLEPGTIKDLHVLTECNRSIAVTYANEDPLEFWKQYGIIQNGNVKRRTGRRPPPPTAAAPKPAKPAPPSKAVAETKKPATKETAKDLKRGDSNSAKATPEPESAPAKKGTTSKPVPVRRESSNLFKSFAKTKAPTKKDAVSSAEASPAPTPVEDEPMGGLSDEEAEEEEEEDTTMFDEGAIKESTTTGGKSKREREEELRAMMDVEDEPMDDVSAAETSQPDAASEADDSQSKTKAAEPEPTETVTVSNGRRRGRRRVMKKKTVKDEEGYLVTREEAVWESFSEDEPVPKKAKIVAQPPAAAKGKKGAAKTGQGSIMSFFSKK